MCEYWSKTSLFFTFILGALLMIGGLISITGLDYNALSCEIECSSSPQQQHRRFLLDDNNNNTVITDTPTLSPTTTTTTTTTPVPTTPVPTTSAPSTLTPTQAPTQCEMKLGSKGLDDLKAQVYLGACLLSTGWIITLVAFIQLYAKRGGGGDQQTSGIELNRRSAHAAEDHSSVEGREFDLEPFNLNHHHHQGGRMGDSSMQVI